MWEFPRHVTLALILLILLQFKGPIATGLPEQNGAIVSLIYQGTFSSKFAQPGIKIEVGVLGPLPPSPSGIQKPRKPISFGRTMPFDRVADEIARRAAISAMLKAMPSTRLLPQTIQRTRHIQPTTIAPLSGGQNRVPAVGPRRLRAMDVLTSCPSVYTGNSVTISSLAGTGINHWWEYEEDQLGGVGRYMVNVATGNMLVQADDMAIPHKGIEMALRRTYNSMSKHDAAGDDGSPNLYGDKWTSTFDAHIAYNDFAQINCQRGVTLFDIDGAHYDYAPVGDGHTFIAPAGQFAKLYYDGTSYYWTKKTGTEYAFWDINQSSSNVGYSGQIRYIYGRNANNSLTFQRTWTTDASTLKHLLQMTVTTETTGSAKLVATLNYGDITGSGSAFRVLQNLVWPDSTTTVSYAYTIQACTCPGNYEPVLTEVDEPGNNVATTLAQQYLYGNGSSLMTAVYSPRWVLKPSQALDGPAYSFGYGTFSNLLQVQYTGDVNPIINDGYSPAGVAVQSSIAADFGDISPYRTVSLCYENVGGTGGCNADGGQTVWSDTDGHQTTYLWDSIGRVIQRQDTTGDVSPGPATLIFYQGWDSSNDLTFTKDPRSANSTDTTYETDYSYDPNGNTTMVAEPSVTTDRGAFRPTSHYTYDSTNNLVSFCDPVFVHAVLKDYPASYSCPTTYDSIHHGPNLSVWTAQTYEPYAELTSTTSFTNYHRTYTYAPAQQQGTDFGLPTLVQGTQFTEADNTTTVTPQQSFTYDAYGNLICYNNGNQGFWILQYDVLNRQTGVGDPDDNYLSNAACSKTGGLQQHTASLTSYYPNGQISQTQTPEQFRYSVTRTFRYDADGNQVTETKHHDNVAATTNKYYDGADRLVEVWLPLDSRKIPGIPDNTNLYTPDIYAAFNSPWITRYYYDLTVGHQVSITGSGLYNAYGNLFDTVVLLPVGFGSLLSPLKPVTGQAVAQPFSPGSLAYYDTKGTAYDALDRPITKYYYAPGALSQSAGLHSTALTYDTSGNASFLSTSKDGVGTTATNTYDNAGQQTSIGFSDTTPGRNYVYDPDGRVANITEQPYGTLYYTYDPNGKVATVKEPTGGGITSPENPLTYHYYPNGWKSIIDVASTSFTQAGLYSYIYRADGERTGIIVQANGKTRNLGWNYTAAGRMLSNNDTWRNPNVTYTYNQGYGDVSTYVMQEGGFSGINYDAEGSHIGIGSTPYYSNSPEQFHTNIRGEFYWQVYTGPAYQTRTTTANGYISPFTGSCSTTGCGDPTLQQTVSWDGINGVKVQSETDDSSGNCTNKIVYGFDNDGRQIGATDTYRVGPKGSTCPTTGIYAKTYDAENHLLSLKLTNWVCKYGGECALNTDPTMYNGTQSYVWGPNGHPITTSQISGYAATLHWDGDSILYTTTNPGALLDDIKVETLADIAPNDPSYNDLTVWDRQTDGQVVGGDNQTTGPPTASGYPPDYFINALGDQAFCYGTNPKCPTLHFWFNRPDGFSDGWNIIQGVRSYSTGLGSWTTPDAFEGDVHDPMSQKPYMWNGNNPVAYQDPSGFCWGPFIPWCPEIIAGAGVLMGITSPNPGEFGGVVNIGKMETLTTAIAKGEIKAADTLLPEVELTAGERGSGLTHADQRTIGDKGWEKNERVLGEKVQQRTIFHDKEGMDPKTGEFRNNTGSLQKERDYLREHGYTYDQSTQNWNPPQPAAAPGSAPAPSAQNPL